MNETEWLACTDPLLMVQFLRGRSSARKLRLLACAFGRHTWGQAGGEDERSRQAVEICERFADGAAGPTDLGRARLWAREAVEASWLRTALVAPAQEAALAATEGEPWNAALGTARALRLLLQWEATAEAAQAEGAAQCELVRDVIGSPWRPASLDVAWLEADDGRVVKMARAIYLDRSFGDLPILADALEEAGCADEEVLAHCRRGGGHVRGCWVLDAVRSAG